MLMKQSGICTMPERHYAKGCNCQEREFNQARTLSTNTDENTAWDNTNVQKGKRMYKAASKHQENCDAMLSNAATKSPARHGEELVGDHEVKDERSPRGRGGGEEAAAPF